MPLQNRVTPEGDIIATPHRGLMMGNRGGAFHLPDRTLGHRRWATPAVDRLRARIQGPAPRGDDAAQPLHRAVLPRRGDRAGGRPPALLRVPPPRCRALRGAVGRRRADGPRRPGRPRWIWPCRPNASAPRARRSPIARSSRRCRTAPSSACLDGDTAQPYLVDAQWLLAWSPAGYGTPMPAPEAARGGGSHTPLHRCRTFSRISPHVAPLGRRLTTARRASIWGTA